jgi:tetratricopeptide (TPR) repeat protein|tara:strand:- start:16119 stop:17966 length:1848 start_codon:yes stop_codon:yes gene_type:complete
MKNFTFLFLFLCIFTDLQAQNPEIQRLNKKIESHVRNPDSTKFYLFQLLKFSSELHDTIIGKSYSTIGIQYNKLAVPDSAEFYMEKALDYTENYPLQHAKMYLNLAINYRIGSQYQESLQASENAIEQFKKAGNQEGVGKAYGEMASNYNYMKNSEMALEYLKKAIAILKKSGSERELSVVRQKLANLYYNNSNFAFARDIYEEVLPVFAKEKGTNYYVTLLSYADCLLQLEENYKGAEEALKEAENAFREMNQKEYMWIAVSNLAQVYVAMGESQQAQEAFQRAYDGMYQISSPRFLETSVRYLDFLNSQKQYSKALKVIDRVNASAKSTRLKMNADNEIDFLKQAVSTYGQNGMVENSLQAFERLDFLKDSLNTALNHTKSLELQEAYQNDLQRERNLVLKKNNELLIENNNKKDNILLLGILSFILLLTIGLVLYKTNRNKLKLQQELVASLETSKKVLEEKNTLEGELRLERERVLENKEKELVQVSMEMSNLQNQIIELIENRDNPESSTVLAKKLKNLLGQNNYWKYFKGKFIEVHPAFAHQLSEMFPNLSENDVAFCCMLKLQLSDKEIAALMGISTDQVEAKKTMLRRKIGMGDDILGFEKLIDHLE